MKKEINILRLLVIFVGIIAVVVIAAFGITENQVDYNELTEVRIKETVGMALYEDEYKLILRNGTWFVSHSQSFWIEDDENEIAVDDAFANSIKEILKNNKVHKWDDFSIKNKIRKIAASVATDGPSYSFYMRFSDGSEMEINDYNTHPETFMEVLKAFEKQYGVLSAE